MGSKLHKKRIYGLGIMKLLGFGTQVEELIYLFIFKICFVNFFCNIFLTKFLLKLSIDTSCSIHEFYKGKLQILTKKSSTIAKKISVHFDHYDLINEEESMVEFWCVSSISSLF